MGYELIKFNDRWFGCFEVEKKLLEEKLQGFDIANIVHVGATCATLCDTLGAIDVLVGINNIDELHFIKERLSKNGYQVVEKGCTKYSLFLVRREAKGIVATVRVLYNECPTYQRIIAFKMYLKENEKRALRYNEYRRTALEKSGGNLKIYNQLKSNFIESVLSEFCRFE